ncbi:MAG TPA: hypothetical protein VGG71_15325 [Chitinophagaceae bacterium]|jgi:hypothetical protein
MKNKHIFVLLLFTLVIYSCQEITKETFDYRSLQFDTNRISIFNWDSTMYSFAKYSEPLYLTNDDISLTDSLLKDAVDEFNKTQSEGFFKAFNEQVPIDSFKIDLARFKRQYFPYRDSNGKRVLHLICFSKEFPEWRSKVYHGGVHAGISIFFLRINLSDRKSDEFSTGGYG